MAAARRTQRCAPGPARLTRLAPSPRRNHGFAPRLTEGAGAEAILSEAPVPASQHGGGCTRLLSRASPRAPRALSRDRYQPPRLPHDGPDLVATPPPPPPHPPCIRLRSDTRSPRPTPGHVSRSPCGHSPSAEQRGPGTPRNPLGLEPARQAQGPRAGAAVTKRLLCYPARPAAAVETASARHAARAAGSPSSGARPGRGSRCYGRPTAIPQHQGRGVGFPVDGRRRPTTGP